MLTSHRLQGKPPQGKIHFIYQMHTLSGSAPPGWTTSMSHLLLYKPVAHRGPAHALLKAQLPVLLTGSPGVGSSWRYRSGTQKSGARLDSDSGESQVEGAVVLNTPQIFCSQLR